VVHLDYGQSARLAQAAGAIHHLRSHARTHLASKRAIAADEQKGVSSADRFLDRWVVDPTVSKRAPHISDVPGNLVALTAAEERVFQLRQLVKAVRAVVVEEVTRMRSVDEEGMRSHAPNFVKKESVPQGQTPD